MYDGYVYVCINVYRTRGRFPHKLSASAREPNLEEASFSKVSSPHAEPGELAHIHRMKVRYIKQSTYSMKINIQNYYRTEK